MSYTTKYCKPSKKKYVPRKEIKPGAGNTKYSKKSQTAADRQDGLSHQYATRRIRYDPETGYFFSAISGKRIGLYNERRPNVIPKLLGCPLHRLAFFYMTKTWPSKCIDHINGDRHDNRWENLREATHSQNSMNSKMGARKTSTGHRGVTHGVGKYENQFRASCRGRTIGYYILIDDAILAANKARMEAHGEFYTDR